MSKDPTLLAINKLQTSLWATWGKDRQTTDWPTQDDLRRAFLSALTELNDQAHHAKKAPRELTLLVCPTCGRTNRFGNLKAGTHFSTGKKCPGEPQRVIYIPKP